MAKESKGRAEGKKLGLLSQFFPALHLLFALAVIGALTALLAPSLPFRTQITYDPGDIATADIKAPVEFRVTDREATDKRRLAAAERSRKVYDYESNALPSLRQRIERAFQSKRQEQDQLQSTWQSRAVTYQKALHGIWEMFEAAGGEASIAPDQRFHIEIPALPLVARLFPAPFERTVEDRYKDFVETSRLPVEFALYKELEVLGFPEKVEQDAVSILQGLYSRGIADERQLQTILEKGGFWRSDLSTSVRAEVTNTAQILDVSSALTSLEQLAAAGISKKSDLMVRLLRPLIRPNLTLNKELSNEQLRQDVEKESPSSFTIKRGEMVIREGDVVRERHVDIFLALNKLGSKDTNVIKLAGLGMLLLLTLAAFHFYLQYFEGLCRRNFKDAMIVGTILVANVFFVKLFAYLGNALAGFMEHEPFNMPDSYLFFYPYAAGTLLVALLVQQRVAIAYTMSMAMLAGLLTGNINAVFITMISGIAGLFGMFGYLQRTSLLKAGVATGFGAFFLAIAFNLFHNTVWSWQALFEAGLAIAGGINTAMIVSGLLPALEALFNVTTDIRLRELLSLDHPLLKELSIKAPGTYHHSIMVANLSEAAAGAVGANPMLCKVGSYFHDIGKMNRPEYFAENQFDGKNPHDKLAPHMSARVLRAHVTEGAEMARKAGLPETIIDFIEQHHGTSLMKFFYHKATALKGQEDAGVSEADFRYPGPKPETKESAIVALADSVEAAVRALKTPTYLNIRERMEHVISDKMNDGQLDNSLLTFREMTQVNESFLKVLVTMYHTRIEYPAMPGKEKISSDDIARKIPSDVVLDIRTARRPGETPGIREARKVGS